MSHPLLEVKHLWTGFILKHSILTAVRDMSFTLRQGATLGIVGESGCGKSLTALSIMRLLPDNAAILKGEIKFEGNDISHISEKAMCRIRGNKISMIYQDALTSLNPVMTIGKQLCEPFIIHQGMSMGNARKQAMESLLEVGISSPRDRMRAYPHQLSGGQRQRVMTAIALACMPKLLITDEPTTALDVTIQAQILLLFKRLQRLTGSAIMLITHDIGIIAEMSDDVLVMYAGEAVEYAEGDDIFRDPLHPYTLGLLQSIPHLSKRKERLKSIPGTVPDLYHMPEGCRFCERCSEAQERCHREAPPVFTVKNGRQVRCWKFQNP
ncbi:MAG: ABC transporter ATP-binding protein [Spirochaetaceae bacterium]|jgi:peptide/nickel transport system ATP-binding protein/oligopeptide transport system ATP-binding protein|nr:ABC transporter ATP-binding protein [Spirochaetaceae bacterium]